MTISAIEHPLSDVVTDFTIFTCAFDDSYFFVVLNSLHFLTFTTLFPCFLFGLLMHESLGHCIRVLMSHNKRVCLPFRLQI